LIVGDIHGCFAELEDLLEKAALSQDDGIVAVGDIVDRGPETGKVLDFFQSRSQAHSVMGNHERKHVLGRQGRVPLALSQRIAIEQLGEGYEEAFSFMASLPLWLELPQVLVVHAFFEPGVPLEAQRENVLAGTLSGEFYLQKRYHRPWYELYDGDKPMVVGHRTYREDLQPLVFGDRVFGIDTRCVQGGRLTGLLVPEFTLLSVKARHDHWSRTRAAYSHVAQKSPRKTAEKSSPQAPWTSKSVEVLQERLRTSDLPAQQRYRLEGYLEQTLKAESLLEPLRRYVLEVHQSFMEVLEADPEFSSLPGRAQGKRYAAHLGPHPLQGLLHLARRGDLTKEAMRRYSGRPEKLLKLVERAGLKEDDLL
jgi:serine/threonine protein phosphatase 1